MTSAKGSRAFYKVYFPGQQRGHPRACLKCKFPGPTPTS